MITDDIYAAAKVIRDGGVVVFPTETVWGIGASAYDHEACRRVYAIKNRPADNPLIIHCYHLDQVMQIAHVPDKYIELLNTYLPGTLTCIFQKRDPKVFSAGLDTVAVRIPRSSVARELIQEAGVPVAAPSANISGKPSGTRFSDVVKAFEGKVDLLLEGPDSKVGVESTIIDLSGDVPRYLRPGFVTFEELEAILPGLSRDVVVGEQPISPGLKYRHYAPLCRMVIVDALPHVVESNAAQIGFEVRMASKYDVVVQDNVEYMQKLFGFLHDCDAKSVEVAYCQCPKGGPHYEALMHRLLKASG